MEQVLTGGNVAGRVVRVGPTVRKPVTAEGHARHWGPAADYIDRHREQWLAALLS